MVPLASLGAILSHVLACRLARKLAALARRRALRASAHRVVVTRSTCRSGNATGSMREVTGYGYLHRFFTEAQRCVFAARDGGCSFPGCDAPPAWCQADHVIEVKDGGKTTVSNGHLLCGHHHRMKNLHGWRVEIIDGRPGWIPPNAVQLSVGLE